MRFSVWLSQWQEPWESLVDPSSRFDEVWLQPQPQKYVHRFTVVRDHDLARLNFVLGEADNEISLDQITLDIVD